MLTLSAHIKTLLQDHDCVILPGFGGFLANPKSAQVDRITHKFTPPQRQFSFNGHLKHNDGLLVNFVMEKESVSYDEALKLVNTYVDEIKQMLTQKSRVQISEIGSFQKTTDGRLLFEPDTSNTNSKASFGLESFHKMPVAQPPKGEKPEEVETVETDSAKKGFNWKYAAAAIALPIIGYSAYLTTSTGMLKQGYQFHAADLNPFSEKVCELYEKRHIFPATFTDESDNGIAVQLATNTGVTEIYLTDDTDKAIIVAPAKTVEVVKPSNTAFAAVNGEQRVRGFHVIAGCFGEELNAIKLIQRLGLKNQKAFVLDKHKGLYRVSLGAYDSREDAEAALAKVRENTSPSAWLLQK